MHDVSYDWWTNLQPVNEAAYGGQNSVVSVGRQIFTNFVFKPTIFLVYGLNQYPMFNGLSKGLLGYSNIKISMESVNAFSPWSMR